jgi:hypothetical protein
MSDRQTVTVNVHSWDDDFDAPVIEFMAQVKCLIDQVPEAYRDALRLDFSRRGGDYDDSRGELSLYYSREETDQEVSARADSHARWKQDELERVRRNYERLKAEIDGGNA